MAKLIYSAIASLDGYVEDEEGKFDWAAPDEEVHALRQRPRAADRDLPLRAPDVRDDGLLGDREHRRREPAVVPGLRRDLAGGREDRLLPDARDGRPARGRGSSASSTRTPSGG